MRTGAGDSPGKRTGIRSNTVTTWGTGDFIIALGTVDNSMSTFSFLINRGNTVFPRLIRKENVDILLSTVPSAIMKSPVPHVVTVLDLIPVLFPGESPAPVRMNY